MHDDASAGSAQSNSSINSDPKRQKRKLTATNDVLNELTQARIIHFSKLDGGMLNSTVSNLGKIKEEMINLVTIDTVIVLIRGNKDTAMEEEEIERRNKII